jgi:thioredoxin reductase
MTGTEDVARDEPGGRDGPVARDVPQDVDVDVAVAVDVLVVGAGPAGLAAAIELRRLGVGRVLVADRELQAGGAPRHSLHIGYGIRDLRRLATGPAYAWHYAHRAERAGAEIRCGTTVTALTSDLQATLTSSAGVQTVTAGAVLLATGCRERPRSARLVPGDRPAGVLTTGELQQRVYASGERIAGRALIVGAEHVSFSAMRTLKHAGADVIALVTDQPRHQSYGAFRLGAAALWRVPVWTSTGVHRVIGHDRLTAVELIDGATGAIRQVPCDTLVFTGGWIPDHELARLAGVAIDPGTRGPVVDTALATSVRGVFAAGNLLHAAETADVAALDGRHVAGHIAAVLQEGNAGPAGLPSPDAISISVVAPLSWIAPNAIRSPVTPPPRARFVLRSDVFARRARLEVRQDGKILASARARLMPNRPVRLDASWLDRAELAAGPVQVHLD